MYGTTANLYIDGILDKTATRNPSRSNTQNLNIGRRYDIGSFPSYFVGQIDEVKTFNYALSPQQVENEYSGGAVNFR